MKTLIIRAEQMAVLRAQVVRLFEGRLINYLRAELPAYTKELSTDELRVMIQRAVRDGATHGIEREDDLRIYAELMLQLGPDFDRAPWAAAILRKTDLWPWDKMEQLEERARLLLKDSL